MTPSVSGAFLAFLKHCSMAFSLLLLLPMQASEHLFY
jgi:hypothetical protein